MTDNTEPILPGIPLQAQHGMTAIVAAWYREQAKDHTAAAASALGLTVARPSPATASGSVGRGDVALTPGTGTLHFGGLPEILIPAAIIVTGDKVAEGQLIEAVALPWFEIIKELQRDPLFLHQLDWRRIEELIAGAYKRDGWPEVILTPRSGDGGRDVIASKPGLGAVRFYDQVKAYSPGHLVTADEVRALFGVVARDQNVSKGIMTTTALFAPGVYDEWKAYQPYRLELRDGPLLAAWLLGTNSTLTPRMQSP